MTKTLVIVLSETRAHELTFNSFKQNVIDVLDADLCLCIGVKANYDYENPFYKLAKYHFIYNEDDDPTFAKSVEYSYNETPKREYEKFNGGFVKRKHYTDFFNLKHHIGTETDNKEPGKFVNFVTSTYIHLFFLWFLHKKMRETGLIQQYDRFLIVRSDYIYQLPYPKMHLLSDEYIWIPDAEDYNGLCDRSVVLSAKHFEYYVDILESFYSNSNRYYEIIESQREWNMEKILQMHLDEHKLLGFVRRFPYISYAVRNINGPTRWSEGVFLEEHGYYIKYMSEYDKSLKYNDMYKNAESETIEEFYKMAIKRLR